VKLVFSSPSAFENENSSLNGGLTLKLLFPGSYANIGAGNFNGTVSTNILGNAELTNANANLSHILVILRTVLQIQEITLGPFLGI
jgi:hypothetical protein